MARPTAAVRLTALAVGAAYTIAIAASGVSLDTGWKKLVAYLPLAAGLVLALWDTYLWRIPAVHRFLNRPRIDGTWVTMLYPTAESHIPDGGNSGPIPAFIIIRQTYWGLAIRQFTAESKSDLRAHFWTAGAAGSTDTLVFIFENIPREEVQHRSGRHFGTCQLDPTTRTPTEMGGSYFTDRYTKGDMTMRLCDRSVGHASYANAKAHCDS